MPTTVWQNGSGLNSLPPISDLDLCLPSYTRSQKTDPLFVNGRDQRSAREQTRPFLPPLVTHIHPQSQDQTRLTPPYTTSDSSYSPVCAQGFKHWGKDTEVNVQNQHVPEANYAYDHQRSPRPTRRHRATPSIHRQIRHQHHLQASPNQRQPFINLDAGARPQPPILAHLNKGGQTSKKSHAESEKDRRRIECGLMEGHHAMYCSQSGCTCTKIDKLKKSLDMHREREAKLKNMAEEMKSKNEETERAMARFNQQTEVISRIMEISRPKEDVGSRELAPVWQMKEVRRLLECPSMPGNAPVKVCSCEGTPPWINEFVQAGKVPAAS